MATYPSGTPNRSSSQKKKASFYDYDPNEDRPAGYPNTWTIDTKIRTGLCRLCDVKFAKCDYHLRCNQVGCDMHICQLCWEGKQFSASGEQRFEGHYMNAHGCWCVRSGIPPPEAQKMLDARTVRLQAYVAEQRAKRDAEFMDEEGDEDDEEGNASAKKAKVLEDDENDVDVEGDENDADVAMADLPSSPPVPRTPVNKAAARPSFSMAMSSPFQGRKDNASAKSSSSTKTQTTSAMTANGHSSESSRDTEEKKVSSQTVRHLHNKTTVIIGAGVVGLSIARELAIHAAESRTKHRIVVVEARGKCAELASGSCAGLLATSMVPPELAELAELSKECWAELLETEDVAEEFHYNPDGVGHVKFRGANETEVEMPDWLIAGSSRVIATDDDDFGKISSAALNEWLFDQCFELGVETYLNAQVSDFKKHGFDGRILSVDISSSDPEDSELAETMKCHNIIVAAGAFTSGIVADLLPWATFSVNNFLKRYEHIRLPRDDLETSDNLGVHCGDSYGALTVSAHPDQNDILAAAVIDKGENKPLDMSLAVSDAIDHDTKSVQYAAKKYLPSYNEEGMVKARDWICTATESGLPIIDKIPAVKVDERFSGEEESPLGIWLCYGFGKFGTTLAPGAARALRRRICGEVSGVGEAVCSAFVQD